MSQKYFIYYSIREDVFTHQANIEVTVGSSHLNMPVINSIKDYLLNENKKEFPKIESIIIKNIIKLDE